MAYYFSRTLRIPFEDVFQRISKNLKHQGFGVIATIDVKDALKQKLGIEFRNYKILSACIPEFTYQAISLESHVGLLLPCNVVIQERENGEVEVSAISPLEKLDTATSTSQFTAITENVSDRLIAALDGLHQAKYERDYAEATI